MSPKWLSKSAVWSLSNFSFLSHYFFFWQNCGGVFFFFFAGQKEKYWAYSSSSFATYSSLFPASIPLGSDGVVAAASGRLREERKTDFVKTMRRERRWSWNSQAQICAIRYAQIWADSGQGLQAWSLVRHLHNRTLWDSHVCGDCRQYQCNQGDPVMCL